MGCLIVAALPVILWLLLDFLPVFSAYRARFGIRNGMQGYEVFRNVAQKYPGVSVMGDLCEGEEREPSSPGRPIGTFGYAGVVESVQVWQPRKSPPNERVDGLDEVIRKLETLSLCGQMNFTFDGPSRWVGFRVHLDASGRVARVSGVEVREKRIGP
jgi:hypothetical protein